MEVSSLLDQVAAAAVASRKYGDLCPDTVRRIAAREIAGHPRDGLKDLVKATRRGLHQVVGAFEQEPDYEAAYRRLAAAYGTGGQAEIRAACREVLALHSSTRERLPILDEFYARLWKHTGIPGSILDLGCGLNPLSLPWMGLPAGARYEALDVDRASIGFVNRYLSLAGLEPLARWQDVLARLPEGHFDVGLLLKLSTTLDRQEKGATGRLIDALNARWLAISFAVASLGGRQKGMVDNYRRQFLPLAEAAGWQVEELLFSSELVFIVTR